ncbi:MAG: hypothetical protein MHMPM18_002959 [Marteilia pararefringens]
MSKESIKEANMPIRHRIYHTKRDLQRGSKNNSIKLKYTELVADHFHAEEIACPNRHEHAFFMNMNQKCHRYKLVSQHHTKILTYDIPPGSTFGEEIRLSTLDDSGSQRKVTLILAETDKKKFVFKEEKSQL